MQSSQHFLLCSYGGGHVALLLPVAKKLIAEGHKVSFLALTTARAVCESEGVDCFSYRDFPESRAENIKKYGEMLLSEMDSSAQVSDSESIAYLGTNYCELVLKLGEEKAAEIYRKKGRLAFYPLETMRLLIDRLKPDVVVATNSPRSERAIIDAARCCGVKSVCFVDLFATHAADWIRKNNFADKVLVLNEKVKATLVDAGRNPQDIIVTGNPAFDANFGQSAVESGSQLRANLELEDSDCLILYASQVEPERHPFTNQLGGDISLPEKIETELKLYISDKPYCHLMVRYHPSQSVEFSPTDRAYLNETSQPLSASLWAADIVVVATSTVGIEASLLGKSVVSVEKTILHRDCPLADMGYAIGVKELSYLSGVLDSVIGQGSFKRKQNCAIEKKVSAVDLAVKQITSL